MQFNKILGGVILTFFMFFSIASNIHEIPIFHNKTFFEFPPRFSVNVNALYSSEPAPMGIADYGVNSNNCGFIRHFTKVLGEGVICKAYVRASSTCSDCFTLQLNAVLTYCVNGKHYCIWTQDVAFFFGFNNTIVFIDNIWNLTCSHAKVEGVSGKGVISPSGNTCFYYYESPYYCRFTFPVKVCALMRVTTNSLGEPVIYFCYNLGKGWVNYDTVTVLTPHAKNVYYTIDGCKYTGTGNFYDIEFVLGGPGGGSSATVCCILAYFKLYYGNSTLTEINNAYNFGSDTAETVCYVVDQATTYGGSNAAQITCGYGSLCMLW
jgi:hypothetical protein